VSVDHISPKERGREQFRVTRNPFVQVQVQGKGVTALWDTGSAVTVSGHEMLRKLCIGPMTQKERQEMATIELKAANNHLLEICRIATVQISLGRSSVEQQVIFVKGLSCDMILGVDFMQSVGAQIDFSRYCVKTKHNDIVPFVHHDGNEKIVQQLIASTQTTIRPGEGQYVRVRISGNHVESSLSKQRVMMIGPTQEHILSDQRDLVVTPSLNTVIGEETWVFMINVSNHDRQISRKQPIAEAVRVNSQDICSISKSKECEGKWAQEQGSYDEAVKKIDFSQAPRSMQERLKQVIYRNKEVLSRHSYDVGKCSLMPQRIEIIDKAKMPCIPPFRVPEHLKVVIHEYIENLHKAGIIQQSNSPFSSPLMLVKKPHVDPTSPLVDQFRVVNDFRKLNATTVKDAYPMKHLYELIDEVANAKYVSILDLKHSFWAQELEQSSRKYTSFGVPGKGSFQFTRSAQGLVNSSSSFQRLLDHIMRGLPFVRTYIDDIVIFSHSEDDHVRHLEKVMSRLKQNGLKCSPKKIQLAAGSVDYLGYKIRPGVSISPGESKVNDIKKWKYPRSIKEVRQFLGLCSFFRRTIPHFAQKASALHRMLRKDCPFKEGDKLPKEAQKSFETLQSALCAAPCLKPADFSKKFILTTDASQQGFGAVLTQKHGDKEHPVAYASRSLAGTETKLAPFHLEFAAMLFGCRHFRPYLVGKNFLIRTDHKPLVSITKNQSDALIRLQAQLMEFQPYEVEYLKGNNMPADGLSRGASTLAGQIHVNQLSQDHREARSDLKEESLDYIKEMQGQDEFCKALYTYIHFHELISKEDVRRWVVKWAPKVKTLYGILFFKQRSGILVPIAPRALVNLILFRYHNHPCAGHPSEQKMSHMINLHWAWPQMGTDIASHNSHCHECNTVNKNHKKPSAPLGRFPILGSSLRRIHVDLLQLPKADDGNKYLVVIIDAFSKWIELVPVVDKTAELVAKAIVTRWILRHGKPQEIISDQGTEFINKTMQAIERLMGITHKSTTAMHPQSNGQVERINSEIVAYMRKYWSAESTWVEQVPFIQWAHNSSYHSSLGMSPYNVLYGRECAHPVSNEHHGELMRLNYSEEYPGAVHNSLVILEQAIREQRRMVQDRQKEQFDKKTFMTDLRVGDRVYITAMSDPKRPKKFQLKFQGPYSLIKDMGAYNYLLLDNKGRSIIVHHDRIKKLKHQQGPHTRESNPDPQVTMERVPRDDDIIDDEEEKITFGRTEIPRGEQENNDILSLDGSNSMDEDIIMRDIEQWQEGLREDAQEVARRQMYEEAARHRPITRSQTLAMLHLSNCPSHWSKLTVRK